MVIVIVNGHSQKSPEVPKSRSLEVPKSKTCRLILNSYLSYLFQLFHKVVDAVQFLRDVDFLRAVLHALATADAMTGLA